MTETKVKEWTVMFYLASDNPLAPSTVSQLKAIKDAGFHHDVNVIAQFDPQTPNEPTHIFDINYVDKLMSPDEDNIGFSRQEPVNRSLVMDRLWNQSDIRASIGDSLKKISAKIRSANGKGLKKSATKGQDGIKRPFAFKATKLAAHMVQETNPRDSLSSFLTFCGEKYPARHYMLFIMGHGLVVGNDLFLLDEHIDEQRRGETANNNTAKHFLSLTELGEVLQSFKAKIKKSSKFELVGFHSCSMSGLEVAYELKDTAHYMLASQGPAFVGSWPYRQILMKVFNELGPSSPPSPGDSQVLSNLKKPVNGTMPARGHGSSIAQRQSANFKRNGGSHHASAVGVAELNDDYRRTEKAKPNLKRTSGNADFGSTVGHRSSDASSIKEMLTSIFYSCLYSSYDFQLAGYSYDLCLSDLTQVGKLTKPIQKLASELKKGLNDASTRDRILLAHLKSQSYWQENYTDLYDFCLCLLGRYLPSDVSKEAMSDLDKACFTVMEKLARGTVGHDNGIIVHSEFAGPAYQYSHGLSVFFPWSEPVDRQFWQNSEGEQESSETSYKGEMGGRYQTYKFQETGWSDFLVKYFKKTMRSPHTTEARRDPLERRAKKIALDRSLLERISTLIYNAEGQLAKGGPSDSTGKGGGNDPTGDCDCSSIKNYPHSTVGRRPSSNFFDWFSRD